MAIGKPVEPIEFDAVDGRPCSFIVLLASPVDKTGPHIQALAGISRLWQDEDFRMAVVEAKSADDLYAAFENCDAVPSFSFVHVVGRNQDCRASLGKSKQIGPKIATTLRVNGAGRFVE